MVDNILEAGILDFFNFIMLIYLFLDTEKGKQILDFILNFLKK